MNRTGTASELQAEAPWYAIEPEQLEDRLATTLAVGLEQQEAARRLKTHRPNRLRESAMRSAWYVLASQFRSALILVLLGASGLAALAGDMKDAGVILGVVVLNAFIGFYQENRAERSLTALK